MAEPSLVRERVELDDAVTTGSRIRVLLVSRRRLFAETVQWALDTEGLEVVAATPGSAPAVALARSARPDVVLIDAQNVEGDPTAAASAIAKENPTCSVIVMRDGPSLDGNDAQNHRSVHDVVPSAAGMDALIGRIRGAVTGERHQPRRSERRTFESSQARHAAVLADSLTNRERQILDLMAQGAGGRAIADLLGLSPNTVRTHAQNVLTKLQVGSRLAAVAFAVEHGIVSVPRADEASS